MLQYVLAACALACPLSMAMMMLLMRNRKRGSEDADERSGTKGDGGTD